MSAANASAYLRSFVDSTAELPAQLQRTFALLRELDGKCSALQAKADANARACLLGPAAAAIAAAAAGSPPPAKRPKAATEGELRALRERMEADMKQVGRDGRAACGRRGRGRRGRRQPPSLAPQVIQDSNEMAQLAHQIYDDVDAKIRRLDMDLAAFDADLAREREAAGLPADPAAGVMAAPRAGGGGGARRKAGGAAPRSGARSGAAPAVFVDPAEPLYCYCQRVSFGAMIACDNPDCPVEWFHYECAGLAETPKGRWFCRHCTEKAGGGGEGK